MSVVVVTYNHEKYISDAIKSILAQKVNFKIEVIIADDGSTDNTPTIVDQFAKNYPDTIVPLRSAENRGVFQNAFSARFKVRGQYIALLDGDDYWDYELKLQKQVDFLDGNSEYNGVFHDAKITHIDSSDKVLFAQKHLYSQNYLFKEEIYPSDFIQREIILPSSSAMIRSSALDGVDISIIKNNYSFFWKVCCFIIRQSKFYFINEPWSVYRNHQQGISKRNNYEFHTSHIKFLETLLEEEFYKNYKYNVCQAIANEYKVLLDSSHEEVRKNIRTIFKQYVRNEVRRIWHYRKKVIGKGEQ